MPHVCGQEMSQTTNGEKQLLVTDEPVDIAKAPIILEEFVECTSNQ